MSRTQKRNRKFIVIIFLLALISLACIATVVVVLIHHGDAPPATLPPDYAPLEEEPNAEILPSDSDEKLEHSEGGGAVGQIYKKEVLVDLSDKKATLLFGNPQKSTQDIVVQIIIHDQVVAQSGRLVPGTQVKVLNLLSDAPALSAGTYTSENCKFVAFYYDSQTGEKAILSTQIPITVTVTE